MSAQTPRSPTPTEALRYGLRLGCISFGGPAGQIAILHRELVTERGWVGEDAFTQALNFCMLLPGPEALQLVIYLGWRAFGAAGGIMGGLLFLLPGALLLLALSWVYVAFGSLALVDLGRFLARVALELRKIDALRMHRHQFGGVDQAGMTADGGVGFASAAQELHLRLVDVIVGDVEHLGLPGPFAIELGGD